MFKRGDIILSNNNIYLIYSVNPYKLYFLNDKMKILTEINNDDTISEIFKEAKKIGFANTKEHKRALTGYFSIDDLIQLSDFKFSIPKQVYIKLNPDDKNLWNVLSNIVLKDELRSQFAGIYFDKEGATATDTNILIHISGKTDKIGIYDIFGREIDAKYPDYKAVIPDYKDLKPLNIAELYNLSKIYKKSILNNNSYIRLKLKDNYISLNNDLLFKITEACLKLKNDGWKFYFTDRNKAILFVYDNNTQAKEDDIIAIQMPVFDNLENTNFGYYDPDLGVESHVSFDFENNTVFEGDKLITLNNKTESKTIKDNKKFQKPKLTKDIGQEIKNLEKEKPVKGKTDAPTEERTKEQIKADYDAEVKKVQEQYKNNFTKLTEDEVILIGLKLNKQRSLYSQFVDNASDNKRRLSPTPENLLRWMKNPGKFDLIGVDTFERTDPTKDYKKVISKQKIFNLFGIKV
jgi:hypothetical protein